MQRTIQVPVKEFKPHKWQLHILDQFDSHTKRFFLLCWHRRARKTTLLINLLIRECVKNPKKVYGYIGPTYKQAKNIIWRDPNMLDRYLPKELVKRKNETELYVEFTNGSILTIKGADDPDSLRGMDFQGVCVDEWALVDRSIWEEIIRPVITQSTDRWAMFSFTPKGVNHAHEYWTKAKDWEEWITSILKASTSGIMPYDELIKARAEMSDALFNQEFECSFVAREDKSLITSEMIEKLRDILLFHETEKKLISGDPSEGGDECVIKVFHNTKEIEQKILHENDTMKIVGEILLLGAQHGIKDYAGDDIGIGKGINDRLRELGWNVIDIRSSQKAFDEERYYNRRTEMWGYVAEQIRQGQVEQIQDAETKMQLVAPKYDVIDSNGKIKLEPKKYTKELLGRSPDRGDCYVYGIWAHQFVEDKIRVGRVNYAPRKLAYQSHFRSIR